MVVLRDILHDYGRNEGNRTLSSLLLQHCYFGKALTELSGSEMAEFREVAVITLNVPGRRDPLPRPHAGLD